MSYTPKKIDPKFETPSRTPNSAYNISSPMKNIINKTESNNKTPSVSPEYTNKDNSNLAVRNFNVPLGFETTVRKINFGNSNNNNVSIHNSELINAPNNNTHKNANKNRLNSQTMKRKRPVWNNNINNNNDNNNTVKEPLAKRPKIENNSRKMGGKRKTRKAKKSRKH